MKVVSEIDVSPTLYFRHLCNVMIKDIKKQTGKNVTTKELIDGYTYERVISAKKMSTTIKISIGPLIENKYFITTYETKDTKGQYYYDFSETDEKCFVEYGEDTSYKAESVGTYFGNLKKKFKAKVIEQNALKNIDLTVEYIKNHKDE